jgi:hypothetical protein
LKRHIDYIVSIILILLVPITGSLGYIQSELELRKFIPHKYFAYTTLLFAFIHILFKWKRVLNYLRTVLRGRVA